MKKISLVLLFLGVFLLPTASMSAITDDACAPDTDTGITLNDTNTTYSTTVPLPDGQSHLYYIHVATPGTVTVTLKNTANKISMNYSENACPAPGTVFALNQIAPIVITRTDSFDFNLIFTAQGAQAGYTVDIVFTPAPLSITKTAYPGQVAVDTNSSVTYMIDMTNNTNASLGSLEFDDTLPAGVTLNSIVIPTGWDCGDINNTLPQIECTTGSLNSKETATFILNTTINSGSDVINTAYVQASTTQKVGSTAIVRAVSGTKPVDLEIQKYAQADAIPPNTSFSYLMFVVNHSQSATAELVTVTDTFPSDYITIDDYDSSTGWNCTIPPPAGSNTFTCDFNRSLGHEITYFTVQATTFNGFKDHVINTATVGSLNPISGDHTTTDIADINITDANLTGGWLGGNYIKGGSIEVSDISFANRLDARLQTKVASTENMTIATHFVNLATGVPADYTPPSYDPTTNTNVIPVTVLLKLADDDCSRASETYLSYDGSPVAAVFEADNDDLPDVRYAGNNPQNNANPTFTIRNIGQKKARLIMKYVDINELLDYSGETCSVSNLSSNIKGLPQCIANSGGSNTFDTNKYINVFGFEAFIRCNIQNGQPCNSANGGYGDDPYDNEYGCYECTVGSAGFCSNDNFAIRPKSFDVNVTDGAFYRAGKGYSFAFKGHTANTSNLNETTLDYNETQIPPGSMATPDSNVTQTPGGVTATSESKTFSVDMNVTNNTNCQTKYLTNDPLVKFHDGVDNGPFKFNDIGNIEFSMHESVGTEFAKVDANDTSDTQRLIEDFNATFTVIPDHFDINVTLTDHNGPNNLTYLHDINLYDDEDNYTMAADLDMHIKAVGEDSNITHNYTEQCYAKATKLTLGLDGTDIIFPTNAPVPLKSFLYYNPVEDNGSADSGESSYTLPAPSGNTIALPTLPIENTVSSFPENAPDGNGTTHIEYKLNFDRKTHLVVNPVQMKLADVNMTEEDATMIPSNLVTGETGTLTGQQANFYYARTRATKFFYEDISAATVNTPIVIDLYCDLGFTACGALGINTVSGQTNEMNWWLSLGHNTTGNNDGNITLKKGAVTEGSSTDWSVTSNVNITANAKDPNIVVNRGTAPTLPLTVKIDLETDTSLPLYTNKWLIYNPDTDAILQAPPSPLYKVRFIGTSGWAGHGDTRHVVDSNASTKKNRRLEW